MTNLYLHKLMLLKRSCSVASISTGAFWSFHSPVPWRIMPFFKRLRKTLPDHCSVLRTEASEQNSPPPNLDLSVCFILLLHDNDTNIKREQKRTSSSKNVEKLNDIKIVKRDKIDFFFFSRNVTIISAGSRR